MSVLRIVKVSDQNPVLREEARPVARVNRRIRKLMDDMVDTMRDAPGVGLAAPQVGVDLRVIVVETPIDTEEPDGGTHLHAVANPEIVWTSDEVEEDQEACLSIPELYGDVERHVSIRLRGLDRSGAEVELELEGFEARVFQHEVDHLDGILFTDRVSGFDKLYHLRRNEDDEIVRVPYEPAL